ncbi:MAG: dipeptidase [Acidobacteriota bacterium]
MTHSTSDVFATIERDSERYLEELKDYLRIPSVSTDPAFAADVARCADFLRTRMEASGLQAEIIETQGHPLVLAERHVSDALPTLLFYGHYDVQPPDPLEEWRNPPFEPTVEGDLLVARGATDDKGQSYAHVKAIDALLATRDELPVNVKFLVEGEEESGGEAIEHYVRSEPGRERLGADAVVVSDSSMYAPGQPSLLYGLKGILYVEIRVTGPNRDLHSGTFGGAVRNPGNTIADIVARLRDPETGRILIPGFYDSVRPLEDWERKEFAALPLDEEEYRKDLGIAATFGEEGYSTLERSWARPTLDVNGLWSGYQGPGAKTVLPAISGAKVSMRLVPDQDPDEIGRSLEAFVAQMPTDGATVEVDVLHGAGPLLVDIEGPFAAAAMSAMQDVWGKPPVKVREGGSIPIVGTLNEVLGAPTLLMGFGLSDDRLHSPNEKFNLSHYYQGIRTTARLLDRAAEISGAS